ncbi:hypothetical protein EMIT0P43_60192 [Pseudomonas jessenii]
MVRNPAHRNRLASRLPAGRQGDVQQLGGLLRVFIEDLVEVAHAVEHQLVRVLVFQAPVLLHHRGVGGQVGDGFIHRIVRKLVERGGAKAGQRPGFSAMGARLPWAVCPTQAPRPGDILYDAKSCYASIMQIGIVFFEKCKHYARYAKAQRIYCIKGIARSARDLPHGASPSHRRASIHALAHSQREDRRSFG